MLKFLTSHTAKEVKDSPLDLTQFNRRKKHRSTFGFSHPKTSSKKINHTLFTLGSLTLNLVLFLAFSSFFSPNVAFLISFFGLTLVGGICGFLLGYHHLNILQTTKGLLLLYLGLTLFKHSGEWTAVALVHFIAYFIMMFCGVIVSYLIRTREKQETNSTPIAKSEITDEGNSFSEAY